jgi:hypothetical protein
MKIEIEDFLLPFTIGFKMKPAMYMQFWIAAVIPLGLGIGSIRRFCHSICANPRKLFRASLLAKTDLRIE